MAQKNKKSTRENDRMGLRILFAVLMIIAGGIATYLSAQTDTQSNPYIPDFPKNQDAFVDIEEIPERVEDGLEDREEYHFELPQYEGYPWVTVNNNIPFFSPDELSAYTGVAVASFESYAELDALGRCGAAEALVSLDTMPTAERESISEVKPTGWVNNQYDTELVNGGYIYHRCHLIGFQLTGENANEKNLITGTRYLNIDGMLGFENDVADYVASTGEPVLYRVTPVFEGDELVARGVLMEAYSVADSGAGVQFCVYCFNVQPGIEIDYATGENWIST